MLRICNSHPRQVWTAILFRSPETCGGEGGNFATKGWWHLAPGSCATVYGGDVSDRNRYWYYYAESDDGIVWAGDVRAYVNQAAFEGCLNIGVSTWRIVNFRKLDIGDADNFTLTLTG